MSNNEIQIDKIISYVKQELGSESTGHDWWHAWRVHNTAKEICRKEKESNIESVRISALIHDVADRKLNNNSAEAGIRKVKIFLNSLELEREVVEDVLFIVKYISFSSEVPKDDNIDLKIVQDADKLDAMGAIGIARAFAYGGKHDRLLYDPDEAPELNMTKEEYKKRNSHTVNHFYEKLFKLKDLLHTETAKKIAKERCDYMKIYIDRFYKEWDGVL